MVKNDFNPVTIFDFIFVKISTGNNFIINPCIWISQYRLWAKSNPYSLVINRKHYSTTSKSLTLLLKIIIINTLRNDCLSLRAKTFRVITRSFFIYGTGATEDINWGRNSKYKAKTWVDLTSRNHYNVEQAINKFISSKFSFRAKKNW